MFLVAERFSFSLALDWNGFFFFNPGYTPLLTRPPSRRTGRRGRKVAKAVVIVVVVIDGSRGGRRRGRGGRGLTTTLFSRR